MTLERYRAFIDDWEAFVGASRREEPTVFRVRTGPRDAYAFAQGAVQGNIRKRLMNATGDFVVFEIGFPLKPVDLVTSARPNDEPPRVVINMAGMPKRPEIPVKDFAEALGTQPALVLPFEPQLFGKAANNGQMIAEVDPRSKAAEGFAHLAGLLTGRAAPAPKPKGLFASLFRKG